MGIGIGDLANALGMADEVQKIAAERAASEAAAAAAAARREALRQDPLLPWRERSDAADHLWWDRANRLSCPSRPACHVPDNFVTVETSGLSDDGILIDGWQASDRAVIMVPEHMTTAGDDIFARQIGVRRLCDYGWGYVRGLCCVYNFFTQGFQVVLRHEGKLLVPPPGVWEWNLPQRINSGAFVPDSRWESIWDVMAPYLAGDAKDFHIKNGSNNEAWIRLEFPIEIGGASQWFCHASVEGLRALLPRMYGRGDYSLSIGGRGELILLVPSNHVGAWIGSGGCRVKMLGECLERHVQIARF
jgi:hypothetical protein